MAEEQPFSGFTKDTIRFFTSLKRNNNREWFERSRENYETRVMEPAKAFIVALGERLKTIAPRIIAAPRVNKSIFRINRDTRFTLDPTPYKTNLGLYFWDGRGSRMDSAGFYVGLEPPDIMLGGGMYEIRDALLTRFRNAVADPKKGREIGKIVAAIRAVPGLAVEGLHYKRVPAGFDPALPNAELLRHKGLYGSFEAKIPEEFFTPRFVDYCFERMAPMAPLHHWLMTLIA